MKIVKSNASKNIMVCVAFVACAIAVFYMTRQIEFLDVDKTNYAFYPYVATARTLFETGTLPVWTPNLWGGISAFSSLTMPFYPIIYAVVPFFYDSATGSVLFSAMECMIIIHLIIIQIGVYFMLRTLSFNRFIAFSAAMLACITGSTLTFATTWNTMLMTISWLPLIFAFLIRIYTSRETIKTFNLNVILAGIFFALMIFSGISISLTLAVFAWLVLYLCIIPNVIKDRKMLLKLTLSNLYAGLIGVGLASLFLLPTLAEQGELVRYVPEMGFLSSNQSMTYDVFTAHTLTEHDLDLTLGSYSMGFSALSIPLAVVSVAGFFIKPKNTTSKTLLMFAKIIFVFSVLGGVAFVLTEFLYYVPLISRIREQFLYPIVLFISVSIFTAYVMQAVFETLKSREKLSAAFNSPKLMTVLVAIVVARLLLPLNIDMSFIPAIVLMVLIILSAVFFSKYRYITVVLVIGLLAQNIIAYRSALDESSYTYTDANKTVLQVQSSVRQLFEQTETPTHENMFRVTTYSDSQVYPPNIMQHIGGYDNMGYWNPLYDKTIDKHEHLDLTKRAQLDNVKYWFVNEGSETDPTLHDFAYIVKVNDVYPSYDATETNAVEVYEYTEHAGVAWFVYDFIPLPDFYSVEEVYSAINDPEVDLMQEAVVKQSDADKLAGIISTETKGTVNSVEYTDNKITLNCTTQATGLLMITESDAPGWKAYIDGEEAEILSVNYDRKGLVVEPGTHEITLVYAPQTFVIGIIISILTALGLIVYGAVIMIKRKK